MEISEIARKAAAESLLLISLAWDCEQYAVEIIEDEREPELFLKLQECIQSAIDETKTEFLVSLRQIRLALNGLSFSRKEKDNAYFTQIEDLVRDLTMLTLINRPDQD